ncbi:probable ADP-ribosylation factor GTPase-activating protein AGD14 isoform X2 [Musa acuminata AAA Group]|uniref:probable ADP-ribosylation factor GTPase-activating protein AGD14 isoform X2 n=1 Tax=Musa acuminata AAA Group TaxID=214697 RepID=UPI0031D01C08
MARPEKEDEKNEKIIRGLLKLPANRRCINCNSLGPQYVCINFWTFICINCSGIHREFTHRVKSISMAKFTSQEVSALQEGGNERAKEIYFKEWDPQHYSLPDNRLREFIKNVYVDGRYTGERSFDRPQMVKGNAEDSYDRRKVDSFRDIGNPSFDDIDGRHYGEQPGSASLANDHKRSLGRFDIIDEKGRDNKPGYRCQDQKVVDQQFPDGPKIEERLPNHQPLSNSPKIKPVEVIHIIPPAPIGQPKKSTGFQFPHSSAQVQRTASLPSRGSNVGISAEPKLVNSGNLIDFDADPIVPVARALDQYVPQQTTSFPAETGGWASFDDSLALKVTQVASAVSTPDSLLSQLSVSQTASAANAPSISIARAGSSPNQSNAGHWPTMHQHQPFVFHGPSVQTSKQPFSAHIFGAPNNQLKSNLHGVSVLTSQSSQVVNKSLHETTAGVSTQPSATEAKPTGRKELPADLFTTVYPSASAPFLGYQTPQRLMGYGTHYPTAVFPNLASLCGALPYVDGHSTIWHSTSNLPMQQWLPPQQISMLALHQFLSSGPYMVQQGGGPVPRSPPGLPVMHQGTGGFSTQGAGYRSGTPNAFTPDSRNPFG